MSGHVYSPRQARPPVCPLCHGRAPGPRLGGVLSHVKKKKHQTADWLAAGVGDAIVESRVATYVSFSRYSVNIGRPQWWVITSQVQIQVQTIPTHSHT